VYVSKCRTCGRQDAKYRVCWQQFEGIYGTMNIEGNNKYLLEAMPNRTSPPSGNKLKNVPYYNALMLDISILQMNP